MTRIPLLAALAALSVLLLAADHAVEAADSPIHVAARDGTCGDELAAAIANGADAAALNARDDKYGASALALAALGGHAACVDALVAAGADLEVRDNYELTALSAAAVAGHEAVIKALIAAGAGDKDAALRHAAAYGRHEAVLALLNAGANPHATDAAGQTALSIAREAKATEIVNFLQNAEKATPWQAGLGGGGGGGGGDGEPTNSLEVRKKDADKEEL